MKRPLGLAALLTAGLVGCSQPATPADGGPPAGGSAEPSSEGTEAARPPKPPATPALTLFVGDREVDCEGEGPMKCLRIKRSADGEWELLYSRIEGFTHEVGHEYELRVSREEVAKPLADGPSAKYRLVEVVSKKKTGP